MSRDFRRVIRGIGSKRGVRAFGACCALVLAVACDNAGADRALGITATGIVRGFVYFDADGSRSPGGVGDLPLAGARVRLLAPVSRDTLVRAVTGDDGTFRLTGVPVGSYAVVIDGTSVGDSVVVVSDHADVLELLPSDSIEVEGVVSFPEYSAAAAKALPVGTRVFVTGVALHARGTFTDTLLHVVDTSGAIRATRVRPSTVVAGDSVRISGRVSARAGQPSLDDVTVFVFDPTFIPTLPTVTSAVAASAGAAAALDAELVRVLNVLVSDTATVAGNRTLTVSDGSGALVVVLDRAADAGFRAPFPAGLYIPGNRFDLIGVLVPTGTGTWRLRPRSVLDLTLR